jgi:hypothetical protein
MVGTHRHPPGIRRDVVDAIRDGLPELLVREVVNVHPFTLPGGLVLPPTVLKLPDQLLLVRIDRHHRRPSSDMLGDTLVEVAELGVPIGMLATLDGLGGCPAG